MQEQPDGRCIGPGMRKGHRASVPLPGRPLSLHLCGFTNLEAPKLLDFDPYLLYIIIPQTWEWQSPNPGVYMRDKWSHCVWSFISLAGRWVYRHFLYCFPYIPYISIFLMYFINREGHDPRPVGSAIYIHRFFSGSTFQKCIHRDLIYQKYKQSHPREK